MKTTNQDICKSLGETYGGNWTFVCEKCVPLFRNNTPKSDKKVMPNVIPVTVTWSSQKPSENELSKIYNNFDWKHIYDESINFHVYEKSGWVKRKIYIYIKDNQQFSFLIPKKIEKILGKSNSAVKVDEGLGGK